MGMGTPTLPKLSCRHGAPLGRPAFGIPENTELRSVHLQRVRLDSGGYDSGGAYWGSGVPIYWATDGGDYSQFIRAGSRARAAIELGFGEQPELLADRSLRKAMARYAMDTLPDSWGRGVYRAPRWPDWSEQDALDIAVACLEGATRARIAERRAST